MMDTGFLERVNTLSDQTIQLCYHCHKCTAGCPVAGEMEYGPDRILRMVQMGEKEKLLKSLDIWICVACETCGTRCPNEINPARVLGALREIAAIEHAQVAEPKAVKFHRIFLFLVEKMGRMHEVSLLGLQKLWTMDLLSDMKAGVRLIMMGKVPFIPQVIKGRADMKKIYAAALREREKAAHGD